MASGKVHDKSTRLLAIPFALILSLVLDVESGLISGAAFLFGGLWLSPDLDTKSIALRRWGVFKGLWWPYQKVISHRSILSHSPFIGTALRVGYLFICASFILALMKSLGFADALEVMHVISTLIKNNPKHTFAVLLGLEASAWLHLIKDGDPLPKRWHK